MEKSMRAAKLKDEHYVLDLCDKILGMNSLRQHRFDFLTGDPDPKGGVVKLPVDAYYPKIGLVIEYREKQHTEGVAIFDKQDRITVSGVHRGEQRKLYDERRRKLIPENNLTLIEVSYSSFNHSKQKRIVRNEKNDIDILKNILNDYLS